MDKFYIRKGSLQPHYSASVTDGNGNAIDLSGAAVFFQMRDPMTDTVVTSASASVDSATLGTVRYPWAAADVSTPGIYKATFEVYSLAGGLIRVPRLPDEEAFVIVTAD